MKDLLVFALEVEQALAANRPVVALESRHTQEVWIPASGGTTVHKVERDYHVNGQVQYERHMIDGRTYPLQFSYRLTGGRPETPGAQVMKLSRADLAACLALGRTGATTVAATMICAHLAGIRTFATGGIGGVHRGAETSFDISADLHELARTPVTVVAAGAKAILDLPKTLEVLETLGVPVIAFGQDPLPAFWSRDSGLAAPLRMDDPAQIARAGLLRTDLGLAGGQLVVNPIPEADEIPRATMIPVVEQALAEAEAQGIAAKSVTPFLLQRIFELTRGRSLDANIALVLNNARLAARIAAAMA
ncbi:pseudouridine-5-phosphate glycosidase [Paracoccus mutanolyticus]|uniref:Pseudouridine-5-phosphate glycosidase n=1 Tax=Paracoccus mutanolyticus TaxID=1499308 RepID=A0ABM6WP80_9RHOB|nr:pseudouridine-5'-phosphate glycosidase [Paracoccus mutanolyticus]AWX92400.1 pseudouridine-5-phosphate glycosidase [Paracoccus mutanolyticus]